MHNPYYVTTKEIERATMKHKTIRTLFLSILIISMTSLAFTGCQAQPEKSAKLNIVTTIFPEYDWVMNVLGDQASSANTSMLLDSGVDLHSFQPTAADIIKISTCDLFIYVGGESDAWVEDALKEATNDQMIVINLLDVLSDTVKEEEVKEGMQTEDEDAEHVHTEDNVESKADISNNCTDKTDSLTYNSTDKADSLNGDGHEEHDHDGESPEYDEHVWLSLKNAVSCVEAIRDALNSLDAAHADTYAANSSAYISELHALDERYQSVVDQGSRKTVLFGSRFPFRYMVDDYDLDYYAAFVGCSAESEASFETIAFLAGKVDELHLPYVLTLVGDDTKIAETIISATTSKTAQVLALDSMQAITAKDIQNGVTYLSIMETNLTTLASALS